jgi:DNA-binding NarL/FixJ family response regulator
MADREPATRSAARAKAATAESRPKLGVLLAIVDFPLLVAGYRAVINATADLRVVGAIDSRETMHEQVARSAADIVVTEWLPSTIVGGPSCPTIGEIRAARPAARVLVIECRCGNEQLSPAIRAGAHGFLTRRAGAGEVVNAIRCIGRGETYGLVRGTEQ